MSEVFSTNPKTHSVEAITYEVYSKPFNDNVYYAEWIVVHFDGGGSSPRFVTGNSNTANFRVLGDMINGGYYAEVQDYRSLTERGFVRVNL